MSSIAVMATLQACVCLCAHDHLSVCTMCFMSTPTLHWSEPSGLDALVISPDLSKANHLPPTHPTTRIYYAKSQFLPPSSSQFATKLHPTCKKMRRLSDKGQQKHLQCGGWGRWWQITVDYCHIECKCMFVWGMRAPVQH